MSEEPSRGVRSRLVHAGRRDGDGAQPVNPALVRASTYLHASTAQMRESERRRAAGDRVNLYGRRGTETSFALEDALTDLEGGAGTRLTPSGLSANTLVFLACLQPGSHVVISDGVYAPVRRFARNVLPTFGIQFDFARADGVDLGEKIRDDTALVFWEMPGSVLFEIVDLRDIVRLAASRNALVAVDNTWASALHYHPLSLGADISMISATKYLCGHSDVLLGAVVANQRLAAAEPDGRMARSFGVG